MSNSDKDPAVLAAEIEKIENREWLESLDYVLKAAGPERVAALLERLETHATKMGVEIPFSANTPYINTIPVDKQPEYPGDLELERRIRRLVRWNAMAMVLRRNKVSDVYGGHISTFASSATLYDVGYNHFFKGKDHPDGGEPSVFPGPCFARYVFAGLFGRSLVG